jgi:hypothetical protein
MDDIPEPNPEQNELSSQAGQAKSAANERTTQEIKSLDANNLVLWIQKKQPGLLDDGIIEKLQAKHISGKTFLKYAGDVEFFHEKCNLPIGTSSDLADLATEAKQSKYYLSYHGRNWDNQLTVSQEDSEQAGDTRVSEVLASLGDEVKEGGEFIPWT